MQIKITISLDNFENVTIESGEHNHTIDCIKELKDAVPLFRDRHVSAFVDRVFGGT